MTTERPTDPFDDQTIAGLVRDAAAGWTMPPVRLDAPGWRERVRMVGARRFAAVRTAGTRVGEALAAALALTIAAALLGVWLTSPHGVGNPTPGAGTPAPSSSLPSPGAASPLPKLVRNGDLPSPSTFLVNLESDFALVDLASGTIGNPIVGQVSYGSQLWRNPDGAMACLCLDGDGYSHSGLARVVASFVRYDASGRKAGSVTIDAFRGAPDPRDAASLDSPGDVVVRVSHAPDAAVAYVGWATHEHPVWHRGLIAVDAATGDVLERIALPDRGDGEGSTRVASDAPTVVGVAGNGRSIVASGWTSWSAGNAGASFASASEAFLVGGSVGGGPPTLLSGASGCGDTVLAGGGLADGTWLVCGARSGTLVIRWLAPDGGHDVGVPGALGWNDLAASAAIAKAGTPIYVWNPTGLSLTRVDPETGETVTGSASAGAATDFLAALGRHLVPSAAAKILLSPGIAISPNGSRIFALGIDATGATSPEVAASLGIFIFDAATLAPVGHWAAPADFVSIAVSPDGRFVYAAGSPVFTQPASITVFDAASGDVRLLAGQLGNRMITFQAATLR